MEPISPVRAGEAELNINDSCRIDQIYLSWFYANPKKYRHWRAAKIDTEINPEEFIKNLTFGEVYSLYSDYYDRWYITLINDDFILSVEISNKGSGTISAASETPEAAVKVIDMYMEYLPQRDDTDAETTNMDYWSLNPGVGNGSIYTRKINVRHWNDVQPNYPPKVLSKLQDLFKVREKDITGGKLILWHGPPGTGKSNAILAMADEWRDWCKVQYVLDPEVLFNSAGYMIDVLTRGENDLEEWDLPDPDHDKYRLLIIEDSEEFLRKDAKSQSGQGMSRLLNATDGLIGQGMRCLILITTNEDIRNFHEAVIRPGRCLANIEFETFTPTEAHNWARKKGLAPHAFSTIPQDTYSLADMYAELHQNDVIKTEETKTRHTGQYL